MMNTIRKSLARIDALHAARPGSIAPGYLVCSVWNKKSGPYWTESASSSGFSFRVGEGFETRDEAIACSWKDIREKILAGKLVITRDYV